MGLGFLGNLRVGLRNLPSPFLNRQRWIRTLPSRSHNAGIGHVRQVRALLSVSERSGIFFNRQGIGIMAWTCSRCTFVNSGGDVCEICDAFRGAPSDGATEVSKSRSWSCQSCTFLNPAMSLFCEACGGENFEGVVVGEKNPGFSEEAEKQTDENPESRSHKRKLEDEVRKEDAPSNNEELPNALLRQLHMQRMSRQKSESSSAGVLSSTSGNNGSETIVLMTYNVWFREDLELARRMAAIGDLIRQHQPHVICLQEVTATIYGILQQSNWWNEYSCSVTPELAAKRAYFCIQLSKLPVDRFYRNPFRNSVMGRELCVADLNAGNGLQLVVATTHLESPCPAPPTWNQMFSSERVAQAKEAFATLKPLPNVVFGGDMNWDDKLDGVPPTPDGWCDVWLKLHPNEPGLTYDSKANLMLGGSRLQKRLDRIFFHLRDFDVESIEMIGTKPIPGLTFEKEKTVRKQKQLVSLPVLPSDHFGLLLKIRKKTSSAA